MVLQLSIDGGFGAKSRFYRDLASTLETGLPLDRTLEVMSDRRGIWGKVCRDARGRLQEGNATGFVELLTRTAPVSTFEIAMLAAGEAGGRLPQACERLADSFEGRGERRGHMLLGLAYPFFLLHLAAFLLPITVLVNDGIGAFVLAALGGLAWIYLPLFAVGLGWRVAGAGLRTTFYRALRRVPVVGGAHELLAVSDYAYSVATMLDVGMSVTKVLPLAAAATPHPLVANAGRRIAERVLDRGQSMSEAFAAEQGELPKLLIESVVTGDASGRTCQILGRTADALAKDGNRRLDMMLRALPIVAYLAVAGLIAYNVLSFYSSRFAVLRSL